MNNLKEKLSAPNRTLVLWERLAAAACLFAGFLKINGGYVPALVALGTILGYALIWLCSLKMNGFGLIFGVLLEYYAAGTEGFAQLGVLAFAFILYFVSLTRPLPPKDERK